MSPDVAVSIPPSAPPAPRPPPPAAPARLAPAALEAISDASLVAQTLEGSAWAQAALCQRYVRPLASMLTRLLGSANDADDIAPAAFGVAPQTRPRRREAAPFRGWLFRIAANLAKKRMRRRRLERFLGVAPAAEALDPEAFGSTIVAPEVRAELLLLDARVATLPANLRLAWSLRFIEGFELTEVAELCGCSLATIKRRLAQASRRIGAHIELQEGQR